MKNILREREEKERERDREKQQRDCAYLADPELGGLVK